MIEGVEWMRKERESDRRSRMDEEGEKVTEGAEWMRRERE